MEGGEKGNQRNRKRKGEEKEIIEYKEMCIMK